MLLLVATGALKFGFGVWKLATFWATFWNTGDQLWQLAMPVCWNNFFALMLQNQSIEMKYYAKYQTLDIICDANIRLPYRKKHILVQFYPWSSGGCKTFANFLCNFYWILNYLSLLQISACHLRTSQNCLAIRCILLPSHCNVQGTETGLFTTSRWPSRQLLSARQSTVPYHIWMQHRADFTLQSQFAWQSSGILSRIRSAMPQVSLCFLAFLILHLRFSRSRCCGSALSRHFQFSTS